MGRHLGDFPRPLVRLTGVVQPGLPQDPGKGGKIGIPVQVVDRGFKIRSKSPGLLITTNGALGQRRQKRREFVATSFRELSRHLGRPVGPFRSPFRRAGFVTIEMKELQSIPRKITQVLLDLTNHVVYMKRHGLRIHFVALQAIYLPLGGKLERPHGRVTEAINDPLTGRRFPIQPSIGTDLVAQVDDLCPGHGSRGGQGQHGYVAVEGLSRRDYGFLFLAEIGVEDRPRIDRAWIHLRSRNVHRDTTRTAHRRLGPADLLHGQFRGYPRTPAGPIPGTVAHAEIQTQSLGFHGRVPHQFPPRLAPGDDFRRWGFANIGRPGRRRVGKMEH